MNRVAIIQARMGSSRLPGKSLRPVVGKPLIWHVFHRLRKCRSVDMITLATSLDSSCDPLAEFARSEGVPVVRGSEDNVLARYILAARTFEADVILRVTGDSPLIDPGVIDLMLDGLVSQGCEYTVGRGGPVIYEGFDPISRAALERLAREAGDDPVAREHVTGYLKSHPNFVKSAVVDFPPEHFFAGRARISVDTPADVQFIEAVYRRLGAAPGEATLTDVVALLKREPELLGINAHVRQKAADTPTRRILFVVGRELQGMMSLAAALRDQHGVGITLVIPSGATGVGERDQLGSQGWPVEIYPAQAGSSWFVRLVHRMGSHAVLIAAGAGAPEVNPAELGIPVIPVTAADHSETVAERLPRPPQGGQ